MYYIPPRFPRKAVLYLREGPDIPSFNTAKFQEETLRLNTAGSRLPISHTVKVSCDSEESLDVLRSLLRLLPRDVDTLYAAEFKIYSSNLLELGRLAMMFQCRRTWLYCLDLPGVMFRSLGTVTSQDYLLTDQRYEDLMRQFDEKQVR